MRRDAELGQDQSGKGCLQLHYMVLLDLGCMIPEQVQVVVDMMNMAMLPSVLQDRQDRRMAVVAPRELDEAQKAEDRSRPCSNYQSDQR